MSVKLFDKGGMRSVQALTITAMLLAMAVVLKFFTVPVTQFLKVGFSSIPIAIAGMLFGPVVAGITGAAADLIKYFLTPDGPLFPGFTISAFLGGVCYGCFFFQREVKLTRVLLAKAVNDLAINLLLNTFWLSILYGKGFIVLLPARAIKNLCLYPIECAILLFALYTVNRIYAHRRLPIR